MLMMSVSTTIAHPQFGMYLCSHFSPWNSGSAMNSSQPKLINPCRGGFIFFKSS